jgi:hypothetical protein
MINYVTDDHYSCFYCKKSLIYDGWQKIVVESDTKKEHVCNPPPVTARPKEEYLSLQNHESKLAREYDEYFQQKKTTDIRSLQGDTSNLYRAAYKTMSQVFPDVYAFPQSQFSTSAIQNIILVGTKNTVPDIRLSKDDIRQKEHQELYQHQLTIMLSKNNHQNNNNMSFTATNGGDNSIDYAEHLYDSTKIKTDDVPTLTDQFAPVENLLNPITGKAYNIEQKQIATNAKVDPYSTEGTMLTFVVPILIAVLWIFYMQNIWRKGGIPRQRMLC